MQYRAVIDRIVDKTHAVLLVGDDEREMVIAVAKLPKGAKPGTWLIADIEDGALIQVAVDSEETTSREKRIAEKLQQLRKRGEPQ